MQIARLTGQGMLAARSLSGLTVRSEGKIGLRQFCCFTEANSELFNEGKLQK